MALTVTFDATITDRTRMPAPDDNVLGPYNTTTVRVTVLDDGDAYLTAAQMVAGTHPDGMLLALDVVAI